MSAAPVEYPTAPLGYVAAVVPSGVDRKSHDGEVPVRLCNYTDIYYRDRITADIDFMEATANSTEIERLSLIRGDVVMTKDSETADDIGIPALVADDLNGVVLGYHNTLLRPHDGRIDSRFLFWFVASIVAASHFETKARGVTRVGLRAEDIASLPVPTPSLEVQRRVADMLDVETARIDTLIEKNDEVVRLLNLRERSLVDQLINVDMPPDAHGWSAPPHWERVPIRSLTDSLFVDGDWIESPYITDSGVRLIQTGNVGIGRYKEQGGRHVSERTFDELKCTEVLPGDILICRLAAPVGRACVAPDLGRKMITSVDVTIVRPHPGVTADYVALLLSTPRWLQRLSAMSQGGTRDRIPRLKLGELRVPLPDAATQQSVVTAWHQAGAEMEGLRNLVARQNDLLRTRRQALIAAAVTGQIDV